MFIFKSKWFNDTFTNPKSKDHNNIIDAPRGSVRTDITSFEPKSTGTVILSSEVKKLIDNLNSEIRTRNNFYGNTTELLQFIENPVNSGVVIKAQEYNDVKNILLKIFTDNGGRSLTEDIKLNEHLNKVRTYEGDFLLKYKESTLPIFVRYLNDTVLDTNVSFWSFKSEFNRINPTRVTGTYVCTCDCNYCTCDCNYCTCDCNYCLCDCNYCTCNANNAYNAYGPKDSSKEINSWDRKSDSKLKNIVNGTIVEYVKGKKTSTSSISNVSAEKFSKAVLNNLISTSDNYGVDKDYNININNTIFVNLKKIPEDFNIIKDHLDETEVFIVFKDTLVKLNNVKVTNLSFSYTSSDLSDNSIASMECSFKLVEDIEKLNELKKNRFNPNYLIQAQDVKVLEKYLNIAEAACLCDCNYCTCDCNYCTCDCNYCTCDCNYCTCDCNYCTCDCNYCACDCNYCTCDCNYCNCDCNYCTCNANNQYNAYGPLDRTKGVNDFPKKLIDGKSPTTYTPVVDGRVKTTKKIYNLPETDVDID